MAATGETRAPRLVAIAPASAASHPSDTDSTEMGFNCQPCVRKKIKCNRAVPVCSGCHRSNHQCIYQAPPRRKRKRDQGHHPEDMYERLARYERILRDNKLLPVDESPVVDTNRPRPGKLLSANGKSRYVENVLLDTEEGDLCEVSDSDQGEYQNKETRDGDSPPTGLLTTLTANLVCGIINGDTRNLLNQHPTVEEAAKLWTAYVQNVEPLCKILHVPTVAQMIDVNSKQPAAASKVDECLMFVIYYFAVFSMSETDCLREFNIPRNSLMTKYQAALCQALINASWLKTTEMPVLQAYTLFLIAMRTQIDPQTFWILTGIAIRLAQRMGLHRDGENLGLPPFMVQMRRRLFWQLLPLDSYAGQVSGTGISISPNSWETKQPLNINDDKIFPGMTQQPQEQKGATEMIFCLSRIELSHFYTRKGVKEMGAAIQFKDAKEVEKLIDEVEDRIETRFLRYADILDPLHFLTAGIVRSAANAVRLHTRMPLMKQQTITHPQRRELCTLAERILDTNSALYHNPQVKRFRWHMQAFFLWEALLCILRSLAEVGFYSLSEVDIMWSKVAEAFSNHEELVKERKTLHVTIGKVTLQAWLANAPTHSFPEPAFITALRSQHEIKVNRQSESPGGFGETSRTVDGGSIFDELADFMHEIDQNPLSSYDWPVWE
ncbi:Zn(II)2Cys6 transcription factor [Aspergillus stella-maris]|uniref:Zn(II)2Cys6 transcription factor n=1 Tax=Aspergillus stella-maris TaxID=1810926 RepID=UPI003CCC9E94